VRCTDYRWEVNHDENPENPEDPENQKRAAGLNGFFNSKTH